MAAKKGKKKASSAGKAPPKREPFISNYQLVTIIAHVLAVMMIPLFFIMFYLVTLNSQVASVFAMTGGGILLVLVMPVVQMMCPRAYRNHKRAKEELKAAMAQKK
jgi:hypothetical protein